jgi:hypothetical protein
MIQRCRLEGVEEKLLERLMVRPDTLLTVAFCTTPEDP